MPSPALPGPKEGERFAMFNLAGLGGAVAPPPTRPLHATVSFAVCHLCRGPAAPGTRLCWSCAQVLCRLEATVPPVRPIFLFPPGSGAHAAVLGYKAAPSPRARAARAACLAALLSSFLDRHGRCLGARDGRRLVVVPVPSTAGGRASWKGRHPLVGVLERAGAEVADVLRAAPVPPGRLAPAAGGFVLEAVPDRARAAEAVVVLDDVYVSGSRLLSAAACLERAGLPPTAAVAIGRLVRPLFSPAAAAFWSEAIRRPLDLARCCACDRQADLPAARAVARALASPRRCAVLRLAA